MQVKGVVSCETMDREDKVWRAKGNMGNSETEGLEGQAKGWRHCPEGTGSMGRFRVVGGDKSSCPLSSSVSPATNPFALSMALLISEACHHAPILRQEWDWGEYWTS